jgi:phosphate transport system protein
LEETLRRDSEALRERIAAMGRLAERALGNSIRALVESDRGLAYTVILRDRLLDELEMELDRLCLEFLVRHQPAGRHLRLVFTVIHMNRELERIGDYAESIARQALTVSALAPQPPYARFQELGRLAARMLAGSIDSFLKQDAELAWRTMAGEEEANTLRGAINHDLAELNRRNELPAAAMNPLMTVARRLERSADQMKNICEDVLYLCTGEFARHKSAEAPQVLFYDQANSSLSQMAEAMGNSLGLPRVRFASAGISPRPLDPRLVEFMNSRGIDVSRQQPKTLDQLPHWEQSQVIITLGEEAGRALPAHPSKIVVFNWPIPDPAEAGAGAAAWRPRFEAAARALEASLRELAQALSDEPQHETKS